MLSSLKALLRPPVYCLRRLYQTSSRRRRCYVCKRSFRYFCPPSGRWQDTRAIFLALKPVGGYVAYYRCPLCGCSDRQRHLSMYMDRLGLWEQMRSSSILHFAPEEYLKVRIESQNPTLYVRADIQPCKPDIQEINVTQIPFENNRFDVVICNHVLEHVPDDGRALAELCRVLKPGGYAILQTPYSSLLENTFVDPAINTREARNMLYGLEDHVRLYGRDLFQKITASGFLLNVKSHADVMPDMDTQYYGVNPQEDLILVTKGPSSLA